MGCFEVHHHIKPRPIFLITLGAQQCTFLMQKRSVPIRTGTLLVAQRLGGQDSGGGTRRIKWCQQGDGKRYSGHNQAVGPSRSKRKVVDRVNFGGKMNEAVVSANPGESVAGNQAENGSGE